MPPVAIASVRNWIGLISGAARPRDEGQRRYVSVARGALSALGARGVVFVTSFVIVPLAVSYLGAERYGAWMTISSALTWLYIADLGVSNGLTNVLAEAFSQGRADTERRHLATAFWLLVGIALLGGVVLGAAWAWVDWARLLQLTTETARAEVRPALGLALLIFLLGFPLGIVDRIYSARQEGALGNLWSVTASVASLLAVLAATRTRGGLPALVLAISGTRLAVTATGAAWLFWARHPELRPAPSAFHRDSVKRLSQSGALFFVVQIAGLVLFNTDNLIIAGILGARQVTPYSVAWTLFTWPSLLITLAFPYLWPAYAQAFARQDFPWIRRAFRLSLAASLGVTLVLTVPLVLWGQTIIRIWAGEAAVPPFPLLAWMGLWSLVYAGINPVACLLNGASRLKSQAVFATASAVVNIGLSVWWARAFGITGVIAATVVSYLLVGAVPIGLEAWRLLAGLRVASMNPEPTARS